MSLSIQIVLTNTLNIFIPFYVIKKNGLVVSAPKMKLCQTKIRFLGRDIHQGTIRPIARTIEFADKFPDEIKDKLNYNNF